MRTILLSLFALFLLTSVSQAQKDKPGFDMSVLGGYHFAGQYDAEYGNVNIKNSASYGFNAGYRFAKRYVVELQYLGQTTKIALTPFYPTPSYPTEEVNTQVNYFQAALGYRNPASPYSELFAFVGLGAINSIPTGDNSDKYTSATNFLFSLQGGANLFFEKSQKAGVRLQGGLYIPISTGGGYYVGSGGYGFESYTALLQFNLSAGLVFRFY